MKKKIGIVIFLIALLFLIAGLVLTLNNLKAKPKTKVEEDKDIIDIDIDTYNKIDPTIKAEITNADIYLSNLYPIKNINKLSTKQKTKYLLDILINTEVNEISLDILNQEKLKHFNDFDIYAKDIKEGKDEYYTFENNTFTRKNMKTVTCNINGEIFNTKVTKKDWILKKKVYYQSVDISDEENLTYIVKIYATKNDCLKDKNIIYEKNNNNLSLSQTEFKKLKDKLKTVIYTFKNRQNTYKLDSIKFE